MSYIATLPCNLLRVSEATKVFFWMYMVEVSSNSTRPNQISPARPSSFYEPYISATMKVMIMKEKPNDTHISRVKLINFFNQSIGPNDHEIYLRGKNFISLKRTQLETWNKDEKFRTFVQHNSSSFESDRPCVVNIHSIYMDVKIDRFQSFIPA